MGRGRRSAKGIDIHLDAIGSKGRWTAEFPALKGTDRYEHSTATAGGAENP